MKAIGLERTSSSPRLWQMLVAAGLLLILLAGLALVTGSAHVRAGSGCADPNGCPDSHLIPLRQVGKILEQNAKLVMTGSGMGVYNTPMPAHYLPNNDLLFTGLGNQPFLRGLFLLVFGAMGTLMAIGPLAVAALMDIRSARRQ